MKDYSQNGESKILYELFRKIFSNGFMGPGFGIFVDIGAGDGVQFSNTKMFKDMEWEGVMLDIDNKGNSEVKQEIITKENVCGLLYNKYDVPLGFDLLSIDIDGNDYHVLNEILKEFSPVVVCCEVNSELGTEESIVMPYNPAHFWDGTQGYGMSYQAAFKLLNKYGYRIYDIVNNQNIIATLADIKPKDYTFAKTSSHPETKIQWQEV